MQRHAQRESKYIKHRAREPLLLAEGVSGQPFPSDYEYWVYLRQPRLIIH